MEMACGSTPIQRPAVREQSKASIEITPDFTAAYKGVASALSIPATSAVDLVAERGLLGGLGWFAIVYLPHFLDTEALSRFSSTPDSLAARGDCRFLFEKQLDTTWSDIIRGTSLRPRLKSFLAGLRQHNQGCRIRPIRPLYAVPEMWRGDSRIAREVRVV